MLLRLCRIVSTTTIITIIIIIILGEVMSYRFSRWRPLWRNFFPVSDWVSHFLEKLNVYQHTKFRQENSVHGWDITICKMAAAAAQYYFRFPVYCCQCVHTVKIYQQTKFCRPISIHSFKSKRPPYWNTTSGFDFYYITVIGMLFCTRLPNFIQNRASYCGNMT